MQSFVAPTWVPQAQAGACGGVQMKMKPIMELESTSSKPVSQSDSKNHRPRWFFFSLQYQDRFFEINESSLFSQFKRS